MIETNKIKTVKETLTLLQTTENSNLFAILDGALIEDLENKLSDLMDKENYVSLFIGSKYGKLNKVAPYLVKLNLNDKVFDWWLDNGWDKHWGILCTSNSDLQFLDTHFKQFLTVTDYNNKNVLFRFYDPRVLGTFLDSCTDENFNEISEPINHFCLESNRTGFRVIPKRKTTVQYQELQFSDT